MKVIMNKTVDRVGPVGDVVKVRNGYARNFLIPRGLAVEALPGNVRNIERLKAREIEAEKEKRKLAETLAQKIGSMSLTLEVNAGDDDKLFGSVSAQDVQGLLTEKGFDVDRKNILLKKTIRTIGTYQIEIRCYTNLKASLKLLVVKKKQ